MAISLLKMVNIPRNEANMNDYNLVYAGIADAFLYAYAQIEI